MQPDRSPTDARRRLRLAGFGSVGITPEDTHPGLVWIAAAGLAAAAILAVYGMPPIGIHLPTHGWGIMGPTCGMTRGVAAAVDGDLAGAWAYNPASPLLVGGALASVARAGVGVTTGRWLDLHLRVTRGGWAVLVVFLAALTVNQQANASLLLSRSELI